MIIDVNLQLHAKSAACVAGPASAPWALLDACPVHVGPPPPAHGFKGAESA